MCVVSVEMMTDLITCFYLTLKCTSDPGPQHVMNNGPGEITT